jgi:4-hydroxy-3-methylbut-2-enyl diphosphate reductase
MPLKILLTEEQGFCFGVKRAVKMAANVKGRANTLGPIIHNPQVVSKLEKQGKKVINSLNEVKEKTLIIRAHGVSDEIIAQAKNKGLKIIDLTCPLC